MCQVHVLNNHMLKHRMCHHGFTALRQCDLWSLCLLLYFVDKSLCVEQETSNAEDCFAVTIVKAKTMVGHEPHKFSLRFDRFPIPLSNNYQLCFSGVTLPLMSHVLACAPISHV